MLTLNPRLISTILGEVAQRAAIDSGCGHPKDIALQMSAAIDAAAETLDVLREQGVIKWEPWA